MDNTGITAIVVFQLVFGLEFYLDFFVSFVSKIHGFIIVSVANVFGIEYIYAEPCLLVRCDKLLLNVIWIVFIARLAISKTFCLFRLIHPTNTTSTGGYRKLPSQACQFCELSSARTSNRSRSAIYIHALDPHIQCKQSTHDSLDS